MKTCRARSRSSYPPIRRPCPRSRLREPVVFRLRRRRDSWLARAGRAASGSSRRDGRVGDLDFGARTLEIGALAGRTADGRIDVRRRADDRHAIGGSRWMVSSRRFGSTMSVRSVSSVCSAISARRSGSPDVERLQRAATDRAAEIVRRHSRPVVALQQAPGRGDRCVDQRQRGDQCPVAAFGVGGRIDALRAACRGARGCAGSGPAARARDRSRNRASAAVKTKREPGAELGIQARQQAVGRRVRQSGRVLPRPGNGCPTGTFDDQRLVWTPASPANRFVGGCC